MVQNRALVTPGRSSAHGNMPASFVLVPRGFRGLLMRFRLLCIALTLMICCETAAFAQCDDESQQNAADEAGIKGDLGAASKCATQVDKEKSQKKLEDAAAKAKNSAGTNGQAPPPPTRDNH